MDSESTTDSLAPERLLSKLKNNVGRKLIAGETAGLAHEIEKIQELEAKFARQQNKPVEKLGLPEELKVKRRKYTMSDAAKKQRQENAHSASHKMRAEGLATGPTSDDGKKTSARNSWKHGEYAKSYIERFAKPCKSTCDEYPCSLIEDGKTAPGQDCLDKQHVYEAYLAILKGIFENDYEEVNHMAAFETAKNMQILREIQNVILEDGVSVLSNKVDKDGHVIAQELKQHPNLPSLVKLIEVMGFTPKELLVTPKSIVSKDEEDGIKSVADLMSTLAVKWKKGKNDNSD